MKRINENIFLLERDEDLALVEPDASEDDLDRMIDDYNSLIKKKRRESDWRSLEKHGLTNKEIYEKSKSKYLKQDIKDEYPVLTKDGVINYESEGFQDAPKKEYNIKNYTSKTIEDIKYWSTQNMITVIYPVHKIEDLNELWDKYNSMIKKHKRVSDWKCLEVFGVTNQDFYEYLLSGLLEIQDRVNKHICKITPEENVASIIINNDNNLDAIGKINSIVVKEGYSILESSDVSFATNSIDSEEYYKDNICNVYDIEIFPNDLPFFTPTELDDFGLYDDGNNMIGDITVKEWFNNYKLLCGGIKTESYNSVLWVDTIRKLMYQRDKVSIEEQDKINKHILELGWNPYVPFTETNRAYARNRVLNHLQIKYNNTSIIDIQKSYDNYTEEAINILSESAEKRGLKGIYLIFNEGDSLISKAIKDFTHSTYSHASIALDNTFRKLYSFNIKEFINSGFSHENIEQYPKDKHLAVFAIFVNKKDHKKISDRVKYYDTHKTTYNFLGIPKLMFKMPSVSDMSLSMFCSQFVDNLLKLIHIDITGKESSLVNPNDIYVSAKGNKNIYKIYEGKAKDFNYKKMTKYTNELSSKAKAITEMVSNMSKYNIPKSYKNILEPLVEVKELPIQLDDNGNMYIKSIKSLNCEKEYQESHRLLKLYYDNSNIDGIKSELCRLWFLNNYLESRILKNKNNKSDYVKLRARVLNDFNKYLKFIISKDKSFDFYKYFESSGYSDTIIKINNGTIKGSVKILKDLFKL